jgi:molecular chaperone HscB
MPKLETSNADILHNPDSRNHFEVLGLPINLVVDQNTLQQRYYSLNRMYHPDYHQSEAPGERLTALKRTAAVNDAYNILRDPVNRGRWWSEFSGKKAALTPKVPPDLGILVFEVQEALEQLRSAETGVEHVLEHKRATEVRLAERYAALDGLFARFDAGVDEPSTDRWFAELETVLADISYLRTLMRDIDRSLDNVEA